MKFREYTLKTGKKVLLGKNQENNDLLVKKYKGKKNIILHTVAPGSPFCVIISEKPTKKDIYEAASVCASKSQDWRDNKQDVKMHVFTGKDVKKPLFAKKGTWKVKDSKDIKVKKQDIKKIKW
jgi:predicted ribosome quality control (RQC) complex YloA/Tae2 family protein